MKKGYSLFYKCSNNLHIPQKQKSTQCPECGKILCTQQVLTRHMNCHRAIKEKYCCTICGRTYTWITSLHHHMKIHEGPLPHSCHLCSRSFAYVSHLKQHLEKYHSML